MTTFEEKNLRIWVRVYLSPWGLFLGTRFHAKQGRSIFMVFQLPETLGRDAGFLLGYAPRLVSCGGQGQTG